METAAIARIQKGLGISEAEAREVYLSDLAIDHDEKQDFDLPPEKLAVAKKFAHTGTRKAPTAYKFTKKERKPNATKAGIIAEIAEFLEKNSEFSVENLEILNKERQISFQIGQDKFEFTLVQKRRPKN